MSNLKCPIAKQGAQVCYKHQLELVSPPAPNYNGILLKTCGMSPTDALPNNTARISTFADPKSSKLSIINCTQLLHNYQFDALSLSSRTKSRNVLFTPGFSFLI